MSRRWLVVVVHSGRVLGRHKTRADARKHLRSVGGWGQRRIVRVSK